MLERTLRLRPRARDEIPPRRRSPVVVGAGELVEEETESVKGIVQLVQHRRREHPDGLVPLDFVQAGAERLAARRPFLRGEELRAQAQVVRAHPEERAGDDREDVVDDRVRPCEAAREGPALEPRLGEDIEDDVGHPGERAEPDVREKARIPRTTGLHRASRSLTAQPAPARAAPSVCHRRDADAAY